MLDFYIIVNKFKYQFHYYLHFKTDTLGKDMNPLSTQQLWVE